MADIVADASVWISYLMPSDAFHARPRVWLGPWLIQHNRVVGPRLLLPEDAGAIARRSAQPSHGRRAALMLRSSSRLVLHDLDEAVAIDAAGFAADLRLRGTDAVYVAVAHQLGLPLITWDHEQLTRAAAVIQTRTP